MGNDPLDYDPFNEDPLETYFREIRQIAPLTREEETDCIRHIRAGDQQAEIAAKQLMEANLTLVVSIAERHRHHRIHMLDLIQTGNEGLIRAVRSFDDSCKEDFSTYAAACIERAIQKLVDSGRTD